MGNALLDKLKKSGTIKAADILKESIYFSSKEEVHTDLPILNIAFSGDIEGGFQSGVTVLAGQSKSYKSLLGLYCMKAYFDKYPDSMALFYDSEFGIPPAYVETIGLDSDRILQVPIKNIEELTFDMVARLKEINRGDKVFIFIDSIGNLASKKEIENAETGNTSKDMTRAQVIKSFFRIITPEITMKDLSCVIVAHTYQTMEMFSKPVVSGGCLTPDTKIYTEAGLKPLSKVTTKDNVLTESGEFKPISYIWQGSNLKNPTPECLELTMEDGSIIRCSKNHKFKVDDEWVTADRLVVGSDLKTV